MGRPWLVAIRHPDDPKKVVTRIPLSDSAMSTSGDYERYFDENGVRYHHIIDPRTGHSASKVRKRHDPRSDGHANRRHVEDRLSCSVRKKKRRSRSSTAWPEYDAVLRVPRRARAVLERAAAAACRDRRGASPARGLLRRAPV